jgi:hypothetical protein
MISLRLGQVPEHVFDFLPLWWYVCSMRVKTSVSLSSEILDQVSRYTIDGERSDFIEKALWNYLETIRRNERNKNDLEKINGASSFLNVEAMDSLEYQGII